MPSSASDSLRPRLRPTTPQGYLIRAFLALIVIGTGILALPACHARQVGFLDCLFTATSAVCVTGLSTVDFAGSFNTWGQAVTLALMQLGGLGVITFAALAFRIVGAQASLTSQAILTDAIMQKDAASEFRALFLKILTLLLGLETAGAVLMAADRALFHATPLPQACWQGAFHAVSAFCNAGFTLWPDSLGGQDWFFCGLVMALIFCGSIGQVAMVEIADFFRWLGRRCRGAKDGFRFSYNTRVVLAVSLGMVLAGLVTLTITTWTTGRDVSFFSAVFQAVSSRTAGFSTFDQDSLTRTDKLMTLFLMFVGGSPGSCAGGIKTTAFAILIAAFSATLQNREEYTFMGRQIPKIVASRARKVIHFTLLWNVIGLFILSLTEHTTDVLTLMFEQISAFGTVGLSLNFTPHLSEYGKIWICLCMFIGRMGPLTIALGIAPLRQAKISHPEGQIMIG